MNHLTSIRAKKQKSSWPKKPVWLWPLRTLFCVQLAFAEEEKVCAVWSPDLEPVESQTTRPHGQSLCATMKQLIFVVLLSSLGLLLFSLKVLTAAETEAEGVIDLFWPPTVVVAVLVRNKAHTLPWFLGQLELLDYPKDRITLWWVVNWSWDKKKKKKQIRKK